MIIHQDITQCGTNAMIEIFADRIEFSNAGTPLVDFHKIVNTVPISRNEYIAGFIHRIRKCEERGSGYDKIIASTSSQILIASRTENQDNLFIKVVLFSKMPFDITIREERV